MSIRKQSLFCIPLLLTLLASCASVKKVTLEKDSLIPMQQYSKTSTVVTDGLTLELGNFQDLRSNEINKKHIGKTYTGFGDEPTPVEFENTLEEVLKEQVKDGLKKRGISISSIGEFTLNAGIEKYWLEEITKGLGPREYECTVKIKFDLQSNENSGTKWFGSFSSKVSSGTQSQEGLDKKSSTLASCMNQILEALIQEEKFQEITRISL